jgi:hypothetical protein
MVNSGEHVTPRDPVITSGDPHLELGTTGYYRLSENSMLHRADGNSSFVYSIINSGEATGITFSSYSSRLSTPPEMFIQWSTDPNIAKFINATNEYIRLTSAAEQLLPPDEVALFISTDVIGRDDGVEGKAEYPADIEDIYKIVKGKYREDLEEVKVVRATWDDKNVWTAFGIISLPLLMGKEPRRTSMIIATQTLFKATRGTDLLPDFGKALDIVASDEFQKP